MTLGRKVSFINMAMLFGLALVLSVFALFQAKDALSGVAELAMLQKIEGDINNMKEQFSHDCGAITKSSNQLLDQNGKDLASHEELIDKVSKRMGVVATVFMSQGDDYVRVITSVRKANGSRAVGTMLGKASAAYPAMQKGEQFIGEAKILEKDYLAVYEPLMDRDGQMIGIYFIGG